MFLELEGFVREGGKMKSEGIDRADKKLKSRNQKLYFE